MIKVIFFRTESGSEPVREWLRQLPKADKVALGEDIMVVQRLWPVGKPKVDSLGKGLWEIRSKLGDRIARIIFCFVAGELVLLHGFIKKTQKTPHQEIDIALKRKKQYEAGVSQ
jgi:phage-related protein